MMLSEATPGAEPAEPSDAELIAKVRAGEGDAYGQLFGRHHRAAVGLAHRYARNGSDAEDLAAEGFANVLAALQSGSGPDAFFRAYLFSSIARLAARKNIGDGRQTLSDDLTAYENPTDCTDPVLTSFESKTVADSFRSLPERWQAVLWYTEIDGMSPAAVAPLLGLSANGVSALAVRAREGLRQSYLQHHITATAEDPGCAAVTDKLGAYARQGLSPRNEAKVRDHLDECSKCLGLLLQVQDVGAGMRGIIFPLAAGLAFPSTAAIAGGGLFGGALLGLQQGAARTWDWARSHALLSSSAASVAAATVAIAVAVQFGGLNASGAAPQVPAAQLPGHSAPADTLLRGGGVAPDAGPSPGDVPEAGLPGSPRDGEQLPPASD
ncbi:sigma-70 family RNA polymerase sigma factor, partial [Arthrobacter sp.]|uniref:sigma-70 family RNA polymerase sigma factor n=1 Tax=Arthrobacter sp. TaxID=1667 RepID=UPI0028123813